MNNRPVTTERARAINPEAEAAFSRGYPHLRELVDGHPHDDAAAEWASKAFAGRREYDVRWPRDVAARFLRAVGAGTAEAAAKGGVLTEAEARGVLTKLTRPTDTTREFIVEAALFLVEAMLGSEWTLEAVLSLYEAMKPAQLAAPNPHGIVHVAWWSGFLLERVPPKVAAKARARIAKLVASGPLNSVTTRLGFIIGGEAALEASGHKLTPFNLLYCTDEAFIAKHAAYKGYVVLDPYLAWRGGDAVLECYVDLAKRADRESAGASIEGLARLASPLAVKVLEVLGERKHFAEQVARALASRSAATKPRAPAKKKATKK